MLSSIHPLGERARGNRWVVTAGWFTAGSILAGASVGGLLGLAGSATSPAAGARLWATAASLVVAGVLDLAGVRAPGPRRQVNERWIGHYRGWVYGLGFGLQLGAGVATFVVTWGVYALFVAQLMLGSWWAGAIVGSAFGLGRSLLVLTAGRVDRPSRLTAFHRRMDRLGRPVHLGSAVIVVLVGVGLLG